MSKPMWGEPTYREVIIPPSNYKYWECKGLVTFPGQKPKMVKQIGLSKEHAFKCWKAFYGR